MPLFRIQIGRDARAYYTAEVEAPDLRTLQNKLSRHGWDLPPATVWTFDSVQDFEHVETAAITSGAGVALATYDSLDGWEDS